MIVLNKVKNDVLGVSTDITQLQEQLQKLQTSKKKGTTALSPSELQAQITALMAQIVALQGSGSSTSMVPVHPVCRVVLDKSSYTYGDTVRLSWNSTGASSVRFLDTLGGKDGMSMPTTPSVKGSASLVTNFIGNQTVTLEVTSATGNTTTCTKVVGVMPADGTKKDARLTPLYAQALKYSVLFNKLSEAKATLEERIAKIESDASALDQKIRQILGGGVASSSGPIVTYVQDSVTADENSDTIVADNAADFMLGFGIRYTNVLLNYIVWTVFEP